MTRELDCNALRQLLLEQEGLAGRLLSVLETENEYVANRDNEGLERIVEEKRLLIDQLETCYRRNTGILSNAGISADLPGLGEALQSCKSADNTLVQTWESLKERLLACEKQNLVNGKLLESSRRVTQQALSILLGGAGDAGELYTQSGKATTPNLGGRTVRKA